MKEAVKTEYFLVPEDRLPSGVGIAHFGPQHRLWLYIAFAVITALALICRRVSPKARRRMELGVGAALAALELCRFVSLVWAGVYSIYYLPLHMCGLSIYITLLHVWRRGDVTAEILYAVSMPGALFALACPDWLKYPVLNLWSIISFCIHILLAAYPIMLISGGSFTPDPRRIPKCLLFMVCAAAPVYAFDKLFRANYMFLNWPSPGSPLEWFYELWGSPGYIMGYVPLIASVWLVLYIPWAIRRKLRA